MSRLSLALHRWTPPRTIFRVNSEHALLGSLLALFVCRAVIASAIVPPWQGPDEPTHFVLVHRLVKPYGYESFSEYVGQADVLRSMGKYRWWEPYGGRTPDPTPTFFYQVPRLGNGSYAQPLYYGLSVGVLRAIQPTNLEAEYWTLRGLAIVLSVVALIVGWAGTRLLFGAGVASGATALAALHPQFLLVAIAVNPDALLNVWGAIMWWQTARLVRGRRGAMSLALVVVASVAGALTKRNAVPLMVVAAVVVAASFLAPRNGKIRPRTVYPLMAAATSILIALIGAWLMFEDAFRGLLVFWRTGLISYHPLGDRTVSQAFQYALVAVDNAWLTAGWLRFPAPEPWLWVARLLTVFGLGSAALLIRSPTWRRPLAVAWLFVIVQAGILVGATFWTLASPQGRYLFPVIAPATALLWVGLTHLGPERFRPYAAPCIIAIMAVLDVTGFATVLLPAYLPWG